MIAEEIAQHWKKGKTMEDLLALGYKKGTICSVQRKLRQQGIRTEPPKGNGQRLPRRPVTTLDEAFSEVDDDPEILRLKKELRKAQLERQLMRLEVSEEQEAQALAFAERVRDGLECLDFPERQQLLRLLVEDVTCYEGRAVVRTIIPLLPAEEKVRLCTTPQKGVRGKPFVRACSRPRL